MRVLEKPLTTVVVQNLSGHYSQDDMLQMWPVDGTFDFMHVPYNLLQKRPLGYIFINFVTHELAADFQRKWHGAMLKDGSNKKPLEVAPAEVQGKQANLKLIKTRKLAHLDKAGFLPLLLQGTARLGVTAILAELAGMRVNNTKAGRQNSDAAGFKDEEEGSEQNSADSSGATTPTTVDVTRSNVFHQPWTN